MDIIKYAIEHSEMAEYGELSIILGMFFIGLEILIAILITPIIFVGILRIVENIFKVKIITDTVIVITISLSTIMIGYGSKTAINKAYEPTYLVIWYENPKEKVEIQKSILINDICQKIKNGELLDHSPIPMPPNLYRKAIPITKDEEKQILEAEKQYEKERQKKIEEEHSDKLVIIDQH